MSNSASFIRKIFKMMEAFHLPRGLITTKGGFLELKKITAKTETKTMTKTKTKNYQLHKSSALVSNVVSWNSVQGGSPDPLWFL